MHKIYIFILVFFIVNCESAQKQKTEKIRYGNWSVIVESNKNSVEVEIGEMIWSSFDRTHGFLFVIKNNTDDYLVFDVDDVNFVDETNQIRPILISDNMSVYNDFVPVTIPPGTFYRRIFYTQGPSQNGAFEDTIIGKKVRSKYGSLSLPIKVGEKKQYLMYNLKLFYKPKKKQPYQSPRKYNQL